MEPVWPFRRTLAKNMYGWEDKALHAGRIADLREGWLLALSLVRDRRPIHLPLARRRVSFEHRKSLCHGDLGPTDAGLESVEVRARHHDRVARTSDGLTYSVIIRNIRTLDPSRISTGQSAQPYLP